MMQELQPGDPQLIGPYRLRGRLGAGGMGQVFLGRSAGGRPVALKVVRPHLATDPVFRERFRREIAVARKVSGVYTSPVIDADVDGPVPWLATAYVEGPSLADAVSEHGPLPPRSVLALAAGLAEGLNATDRSRSFLCRTRPPASSSSSGSASIRTAPAERKSPSQRATRPGPCTRTSPARSSCSSS